MDASKVPGDEYRWDDDLDYSINKLPCKSNWTSREELLAMMLKLEEAPRDEEPAPIMTRAQLGLPPRKTHAELLRDCARGARHENVVYCWHKESHEELKDRLEQLMGETVERMLEIGKARKKAKASMAMAETVYVVPPPEAFVPPDRWLDEESELSPREIRALKNRKEMILKAIPDFPSMFTVYVFAGECVYDVLERRAYGSYAAFGLKHLYNALLDCYGTRDYDSQKAGYYMEYVD